ncbi:RNA polymerase sigma-70 factor [Prolixibacteraceae bacterium JC049]|nr:RNA polymerase sigma-70 factor [Prolixibacteraceae bacterium JC049]
MTTNLLLQLKKSDKVLFDALFDKHYKSLCSYAYTLVRDYSVAEDLVQDLFVRIWHRRSELKIADIHGGYLFKAVYAKCLDVLKHDEVKKRYEQELKSGTLLEFDESISQFELSEKLKTIIEKLPVRRKEIFFMSKIHGMTYKEIAEELDISVNTVDTQLRRTLQLLRSEMKDYLPILPLIFFENI